MASVRSAKCQKCGVAGIGHDDRLCAVRTGDVAELDRIADTWAPTHLENNPFGCYGMLQDTCGLGACDRTLKWLFARLRQTQIQDNEIDYALRAAMRHGLKHLKSLAANMIAAGISTADRGYSYNGLNSLLCRACELDLAIVKWMFGNRDYAFASFPDRELGNKAAISAACRAGKLEIAKWLRESVPYTAEDALVEYGGLIAHDTFEIACQNNHVDVVAWLVEEVGVDLWIPGERDEDDEDDEVDNWNECPLCGKTGEICQKLRACRRYFPTPRGLDMAITGITYCRTFEKPHTVRALDVIDYLYAKYAESGRLEDAYRACSAKWLDDAANRQ